MRRLVGGVAVMTAGRGDELATNYCMTVTSLPSLSATQQISTSKINLPGQRIELASRTERQVHPDAAHVLAELRPTIDYRRHVDATGCEEEPSNLKRRTKDEREQ